MTKLLLPEKIKNVPAPSDAYIKIKIIDRYKKISDDSISQLYDLIKKLCTSSRLSPLIKFVIYQPNFHFEITAPETLSESHEIVFSVDPPLTPSNGIIIIPEHRLNSLMLTPDRFEHEFWHAIQFFLHHPSSFKCDTPIGATNTYPFLPLTSSSLNRDWRLSSAVLSEIRKIRQQLEPFLEGPLPDNLDSLPEPSRRFVKNMEFLSKSLPYKILYLPQKNCLPTAERLLRRSATKQLIGEIDPSLKVRAVLESSGRFGQMQCVTYTYCSQVDHPICQSLDWTAFAIGRIYSYEYPDLKLNSPLAKNLAQHPAVFWNALVKHFPQSQLMYYLNTTTAFEAIKLEFPVPRDRLLSVSSKDRYKLFLQAAKIPPDELNQQLNLLGTQIQEVIKLIFEADTIFMTELGDHIYDIESYRPISELHQQNLNSWLGFCSNGTAMIHLPDPEECLNQPARCGEFPVSLTEGANQSLSINFQSVFGSFVVGFTMQSLQHKISPASLKKLSSALEFCALIVCAGPVFGTLGFALAESLKFANRRYGWFAESKANTAIRALPIGGLFATSGINGLAKTGLALVANFTSAIAGSKLADWAFRK